MELHDQRHISGISAVQVSAFFSSLRWLYGHQEQAGLYGVVSRPGLIGSLLRVVFPMILISIDGSLLAQGGLLFTTISVTQIPHINLCVFFRLQTTIESKKSVVLGASLALFSLSSSITVYVCVSHWPDIIECFARLVRNYRSEPDHTGSSLCLTAPPARGFHLAMLQISYSS